MVLDAVSNFVRGTADAAVGASDTTVSVADASIFPDPETDGEFNVVIWDVNNFPRPDQDSDVEIMRVTARDTTADELTVTRGQETTSAATHPEGSAIHLSPTAKMFSDIDSTFGDFWDAGTQELTADVNNTNTTTTALEAGSVSTDQLSSGGTQILSVIDIADIEERDEAFDYVFDGLERNGVYEIEVDLWSFDSGIDLKMRLDDIDTDSYNYEYFDEGERSWLTNQSEFVLSDLDASIYSATIRLSGSNINANVNRVGAVVSGLGARSGESMTFGYINESSLLNSIRIWADEGRGRITVKELYKL